MRKILQGAALATLLVLVGCIGLGSIALPVYAGVITAGTPGFKAAVLKILGPVASGGVGLLDASGAVVGGDPGDAAIVFDTGLGAINQITGPSDQEFAIRAGAGRSAYIYGATAASGDAGRAGVKGGAATGIANAGVAEVAGGNAVFAGASESAGGNVLIYGGSGRTGGNTKIDAGQGNISDGILSIGTEPGYNSAIVIGQSGVTTKYNGITTVPEQAAPSTPESAYVALYAKSDGLLYSKDDAGTETLVSGAGRWVSGTFTGNWVDNTTYSGTVRRVSPDAIEVEVEVALTGAPTSANLNVYAPTGFTSAQGYTAVGVGYVYQASGGVVRGPAVVIWDAGVEAFVLALTSSAPNTTTYVSQAFPHTFATGDVVRFSARLKVAE